MTDTPMPHIENAPGLVFRARKTGWLAVWQCRSDLAKRGFKPVTVPLWRGVDPSEIDRAYIADQCQRVQAEMLVWGRGGLPEVGPYDGTIRGLIHCYRHDPDSPFRKLRYHSRENYGHFLKRIEADYGDHKIADLKGRDMLRWHEAWTANGHIPMAHGLMRMFRGLLSFGLTIMDDDECARLSGRLKSMRFKMGAPRTERLTAEQADLIRAEAHRRGLHSVALAQAIQFEGMLRQRDVIGEWVPIDEPGTSDVVHSFKREGKTKDMKWLRGIRWNEIDENLVLKHVTSKRQKLVEIRLSEAPMAVEELANFAGTKEGPVIVSEWTGRPWTAVQFRQIWRELADACGIPKTVRNQDSRAGAISEASDAGAPMEHIRHAATHSNISTTERYSRGAADKGANVLKMRVAHRNKSGT
jgi:integrase-like protein